MFKSSSSCCAFQRQLCKEGGVSARHLALGYRRIGFVPHVNKLCSVVVFLRPFIRAATTHAVSLSLGTRASSPASVGFVVAARIDGCVPA
jgi:hypothetical protein